MVPVQSKCFLGEAALPPVPRSKSASIIRCHLCRLTPFRQTPPPCGRKRERLPQGAASTEAGIEGQSRKYEILLLHRRSVREPPRAVLPASKPLGYSTTIICPCPSRLLKKAHLPRWRARAALRRTRKYASHLHPSCGWVPGAPPCIWTFLSSLGENGFFSILLERRGAFSGSCGRERASSASHGRR